MPKYWGFEAVISTEEVVLKRPQRGRPSNGCEPPRELRCKIDLRLGSQQTEVIQRETERLSTLVLITNVEDKTPQDVLRDYHGQFLAEQNWRFIKVPWHLSPVFLKLPRRVESFAYVLLFALIIYRLIQHRARTALTNSPQKKMLLPGKIWRDTPTTDQLLDMLQRVEVRLSIAPSGLRHRSFSRLRPEVRRVFELLNVDPLILTHAYVT